MKRNIPARIPTYNVYLELNDNSYRFFKSYKGVLYDNVAEDFKKINLLNFKVIQEEFQGYSRFSLESFESFFEEKEIVYIKTLWSAIRMPTRALYYLPINFKVIKE